MARVVAWKLELFNNIKSAQKGICTILFYMHGYCENVHLYSKVLSCVAIIIQHNHITIHKLFTLMHMFCLLFYFYLKHYLKTITGGL